MSFQTSPYEANAPQQANGVHLLESASALPPGDSAHGDGPQIQKRYLWIDLPQEEYPGFRARIWVNYPGRIHRAIFEGQGLSVSERIQAIAQVIVEHNGWRDEEGAPYPPADDVGERCEAKHADGEECLGVLRDGFWDALGPELAGALLAAVMAQAGKLSTSLVQPRRRR